MPPDVTWLTADRSGRPEHHPESEPVLVDHDGSRVVLILDDGERLAFDRSELRAALDAGVAARAA